MYPLQKIIPLIPVLLRQGICLIFVCVVVCPNFLLPPLLLIIIGIGSTVEFKGADEFCQRRLEFQRRKKIKKNPTHFLRPGIFRWPCSEANIFWRRWPWSRWSTISRVNGRSTSRPATRTKRTVCLVDDWCLLGDLTRTHWVSSFMKTQGGRGPTFLNSKQGGNQTSAVHGWWLAPKEH